MKEKTRQLTIILLGSFALGFMTGIIMTLIGHPLL